MNPQMQNLQIWRADCAAFCLSFHPSMDIWVASTSWLLWITLQWTWEYKSLCEILLWILLEMYQSETVRSEIVGSHGNSVGSIFSALLLQAPYETYKSHWRTFTLLRTSWFCSIQFKQETAAPQRSRGYFKSGKRACSFGVPSMLHMICELIKMPHFLHVPLAQTSEAF